MTEAYQSLMGATRRFHLKDPAMGNEELAEKLELRNTDTDANGVPSCFFYTGGHVVMVRITNEVVGVFHTFQSYGHAIEQKNLGTATTELLGFK